MTEDISYDAYHTALGSQRRADKKIDGSYSQRVLALLKHSIPFGEIKTGKTGLPVLVLPKRMVHDRLIGPVRVFYNLAPRQFRVVNDLDKKFEFRSGSAQDVIDVVSMLYDVDLAPAPDELVKLR